MPWHAHAHAGCRGVGAAQFFHSQRSGDRRLRGPPAAGHRHPGGRRRPEPGGGAVADAGRDRAAFGERGARSTRPTRFAGAKRLSPSRTTPAAVQRPHRAAQQLLARPCCSCRAAAARGACSADARGEPLLRVGAPSQPSPPNSQNKIKPYTSHDHVTPPRVSTTCWAPAPTRCRA